MGCHLCEVQCQIAHSQYRDPVKAFKKADSRPIARLRVEAKGEVSFSLQCRHCDEPYCTYACITGALHKDEVSGIVTYDAEKCAGCWTCIIACPYGAIKQDKNHGIIAKCDLCMESDMPACVSACPNEALIFAEVNEPLPTGVK
jgi:carbon-monoxide dehydrogenase iron sulfur subunit